MMPAGMTANLDLASRLTALWTRLVDTVSGIIDLPAGLTSILLLASRLTRGTGTRSGRRLTVRTVAGSLQAAKDLIAYLKQ